MGNVPRLNDGAQRNMKLKNVYAAGRGKSPRNSDDRT
jgi:hypothetical protein